MQFLSLDSVNTSPAGPAPWGMQTYNKSSQNTMPASRKNSPARRVPLSLPELTIHFAARCDALKFGKPVTHCYNPLVYAQDAHIEYLERYGSKRKRVLFVGMNPGPWGMAQSGIPFGDTRYVREWIKIKSDIRQPAQLHPKRPVLGLSCQRREISGQRLWGLFQQRFGSARNFFAEHLVMNYCPLLFSRIDHRHCVNITPDKLAARERQQLYQVCDEFMRQAVSDYIKPEYIVAVGNFAETRLRGIFPGGNIVKILHPSPASPKANSGFASIATETLCQFGIW